MLQYAVLELPDVHGYKSTNYAVPACTLWLENVSMKICTETGKESLFAAICKWPSDESKLSDYLEKKKKPTNTWITYKHVKILKLCSTYNILYIFLMFGILHFHSFYHLYNVQSFFGFMCCKIFLPIVANYFQNKDIQIRYFLHMYMRVDIVYLCTYRYYMYIYIFFFYSGWNY